MIISSNSKISGVKIGFKKAEENYLLSNEKFTMIFTGLEDPKRKQKSCAKSRQKSCAKSRQKSSADQDVSGRKNMLIDLPKIIKHAGRKIKAEIGKAYEWRRSFFDRPSHRIKEKRQISAVVNGERRR